MEPTSNVVSIKTHQHSAFEESLKQLIRQVLKEEYPSLISALKKDLSADPSQPNNELKPELLELIRRDNDVHDALNENFSEHIEAKVHDEVGENVGEIVEEKIGEYDYSDILQEEVYSKLSLEPKWD